MTLDEMLTLQTEKRAIPYLTGGEAKVLLEEITRLRAVERDLERANETVKEVFLRGALAARHAIAERLGAKGHADAAGEARSFPLETLLNKGV